MSGPTHSSADLNFGAQPTLESSAYTNAAGDDARVTYLKFDVADFDATQDGWVKSAKLQLSGGLNATLDDAVDYTVFGVDGAWNELTATWNNQPGFEPFGIDADDIRKDTVRKHTWDVTNYVREAVNAGRAHVSFAVVGGAETGVFASFGSREGDTDNVPQLQLKTRPIPADYTTTIAVIDDAFVRGGGGADQNFGGDERLRVRRSETGNTNAERRAFLKFDLAGLDGEALQALMRIRGNYVPDAGSAGPRLLAIYGIDDAWNESDVTWNSAPSPLSDEPLSVALVEETRGWVDFDITEHVRQRLAAGDTTMSLELAGIGETSGAFVFDSKDRVGKKPPELNLLFAEPLAPETPSDVEISTTAGYAAITWAPARVAIDHYRVELSRDDGGQWYPLAEVSSETTSYHDPRITTSQDYLYRVIAVTHGGSEFEAPLVAQTTTEADETPAWHYRLLLVDNTLVGDGVRNVSSSLAITELADGHWLAARTAEEAALVGIQGSVTIDGIEYDLQTSGAFRLHAADGTITISIEEDFGRDAFHASAYDWADWSIRVGYERAYGRLSGLTRGQFDRAYDLHLYTAAASDVASWIIDWGDGSTTQVPHTGTGIQVIKHQYELDNPPSDGSLPTTSAYTIKAQGVKTDGSTQEIRATRVTISESSKHPAGPPEGEVQLHGDLVERATVLRAFEDVYASIKFQPYVGSKKSVDGVRESGSANAWDQARLLKHRIETETSTDFNVQYVFDVVEAPGSHVARWLGTRTSAAAEAVLAKAGLLARWNAGGNKWQAVAPDDTYVPAADGAMITFWHTWLRMIKPAGLGSATTWDLDPSWRYRAFPESYFDPANDPTAHVVASLPFIGPAQDDYLDVLVPTARQQEPDPDNQGEFLPDRLTSFDDIDDRQSPVDFYSGRLMEFISNHADLVGRVSLGDIALDPPIIAKKFSDAPVQTEYRRVANAPGWIADDPTEVRNAVGNIVGDWTHRIAIHVVANDGFENLYTRSLPDLGQNLLTIDYGPGLQNPGVYILQEGVDPLQFGFNNSPSSDELALFTGVGAHLLVPDDAGRTDLTWTLAALRPGVATPAIDVSAIATKFKKSFERDKLDRHALVLDAQQYGATSFAPLQRWLIDRANVRDDGAAFIRGLLAMSSLRYSELYQEQLSLGAALTGHAAVESGLRFGLVSSERIDSLAYPDATPTSSAELQNPVLIDRSNDPAFEGRRHFVNFDLALSTSGLVATGADDSIPNVNARLKAARILAGYTSSYLEHAVLEEVANAKSVSTIKVFQYALADVDSANQPVVGNEPISITSEAQIDALFVDPNNQTNEPGWKALARAAIRADFLAGFEILVTPQIVQFPESGKLQTTWQGIAWHRYHSTTDQQGFFILNTAPARKYTILGGGSAIEQQLDLGEVGDDQKRLAPYGSGVVNLYTGSLGYTETDISIPNPTLPLELVRYYDSSRGEDLGFGHGWGHTYSDTLTLLQKEINEGVSDPENAAPRVVLNAGDGSNYVFRRASYQLPVNGVYEDIGREPTSADLSNDDLRVVYRLPSGTYGSFIFTAANNTYTFVDKSGSYRQFKINQAADRYLLRAIGDKLGNTLNIVYPGQTFDPATLTHTGNPTSSHLTHVYYKEANHNLNLPPRFLSFDWTEQASTLGRLRISMVTDFAGREWEYSYASRAKELWNRERDHVGTALGMLQWKVEPHQALAGHEQAADATRNASGAASRLGTRYDYQDGLYNGGKLIESSRFHNVEETGEPGEVEQYAGVQVGAYSFEYYGNGRVFAITDPEHHTEYYSYNLFSQRDNPTDDRKTFTAAATRIDQVGNASRTVYDLAGLSTYIVDADGSRIDQTWHMYEAPPTSGNATYRNKAELGSWRMVERRNEVGLYESFSFDPRGNVSLLISQAHGRSWFPASGNFASFSPTTTAVVTDTQYHTTTIGLSHGTMVRTDGPSRVETRASGIGLAAPPRVTNTTYNSLGLPHLTTVDNRFLDEAGVWQNEQVRTQFDYLSNGLVSNKHLPRYFTAIGPAGSDDQFIESYVYDPNGSGQVHVVSRGGVGALTTSNYDAIGLGRALTTSDATGRTQEFKYDVLGRLVERWNTVFALEDGLADPLESRVTPITTFDYEGDFLSRITRPHHLDRDAEFNYVWSKQKYDLRGFRIQTDDQLTGAKPRVSYDARGNLSTETDALGHVTRHLYDDLGRRYQTIRPDGSYELTIHDGVGRVIEHHTLTGAVVGYAQDPHAVTRTTYDGFGRTARIEDQAGQFTLNDYNVFGEPVTETFFTPLGPHSAVNYVRDDLGRVVQQSATDAATQTTRYDHAGNVIRTELSAPDQIRVAQSRYDYADRQTETIHGVRELAALGLVNGEIRIELPSHGVSIGDRVWITTNQIDASFFVSRIDHSGLFFAQIDAQTTRDGSAITSTSFGNPNYVGTSVSSTTYDDAGKIVTATDPRGHVTINIYGEGGRLKHKVLPDPDASPAGHAPDGPEVSPIVSYEHYLDGTLARRHDPSTDAADGVGRNVTRYWYEFPVNALIEGVAAQSYMEDPTGRVSLTVTDLAGRQIASQDAAGRLTTMTLDSLGRTVQLQAPAVDVTTPGAEFAHGHPTTINVYDHAGHLRSGVLIEDGQPVAAEARTDFDELGRAVASHQIERLATPLSPIDWASSSTATPNIALVKFKLTAGHGIVAGDWVLVTDGHWTELTSVGGVRSTRINAAAGSGGAMYVVDGVDGDWIKLRVNAQDANTLSIFLPDGGFAGTVVQKVKRLTASTQAYFANQLTRSTDARGYVTRIEHDAVGRPLRTFTARQPHTDPTAADLQSESVYNRFGELIAAIAHDASGNTDSRETRYNYDALGRQVRSWALANPGTNPTVPGSNDVVITTGYDARGDVRWSTDARGNAQLQTDPWHNVVHHWHTSTTDYDGLGRVIRTASPDADVHGQSNPDPSDPDNGPTAVVTTSYDPAGNAIETIDPLGRRTHSQFDALNRVILTAVGGRPVRRLTVNNNQITIAAKDHGLQVGDRLVLRESHAAINGEYNVQLINDANEFTIAFNAGAPDGEYPAVLFVGVNSTAYHPETGNVSSNTDPRGTVTLFAYDSLDRRISTSVDPDGVGSLPPVRTHTTYDAAGRVGQSIDPRGNKTRTTYDPLGRKTSVELPRVDTDADGVADTHPVTRYEYDEAGNVIALTDPRGVRTETRYDFAGRAIESRTGRADLTLVSVGSAAGLSTVADTFDHDGALHGQTTADGSSTWEVLLGNNFSTSNGVVNYDGNEYATAVFETGSTDGRVEIVVDSAGFGGPGLAARVTDIGNMIRVYRHPNNGNPSLFIQSIVNGVATNLIYSSLNFKIPGKQDLEPGDRLALEVDGSTIRLFVNDFLFLSTTDPNASNAGTKWGLSGRHADANGGSRARSVYFTSSLGSPGDHDVDSVDLVAPGHGYTPGHHLHLLVEGEAASAVLPAVVVNHEIIRVRIEEEFTLPELSLLRSVSASYARTAYNDFGEVISTSDVYGATTRTEYDELGRVRREILPHPDPDSIENGPTTTFGYDVNGNVEWTTSPRFEIHVGTNATQAQREAARSDYIFTSFFEYDALNRKITETLPDPEHSANAHQDVPQSYFTYDALGNVIETRTERTGLWFEENLDDDVSLSTYDHQARLIAAAAAARFASNASLTGPVTNSDPKRLTVDLADHGFSIGDLVVLRSASQPRIDGAYLIDPTQNHNPLDPNQFILNLGFDFADLPDLSDLLVGRFGSATRYDANGNAVQTLDPLGRAIDHTYDRLNRRTHETLPTVTFADELGNTYTDRPVTETVYDASGNVIRTIFVDAAHTTETDFDALNRPIVTRLPSAAPGGAHPTEKHFYDLAGNVVTQVDSRLQSTSFEYDVLGRQVRHAAADGAEVRTSFDPNGNAMFVVTPRGVAADAHLDQPLPTDYTSHTEYDRLNRPIVEIGIDPDGAAGSELPAVTYTRYDVGGNPTHVTDALGHQRLHDDPTLTLAWLQDNHINTTQINYDGLGRQRVIFSPSREPILNPDGKPVPNGDVPEQSILYDKLGNVIARTDSNDNQTRYYLDAGFRTEREVITLDGTDEQGAPNETRAFTYDNASNLVGLLNRNQQSITYHYDELNRQVGETWDADTGRGLPQRDLAFGYDLLGRRVFAQDNDTRYQYSYDDLDRLKTEVRVAAHNSAGPANDLPDVAISHAYDIAGNLVERTTQLSGATDHESWFAYDEVGRLTAQFDKDITGTRQVNFGYDLDGARVSLDRWAGAGANSPFATGNAPASPALPGTAVSQTSYEFDNAGRPTRTDHNGAGTANVVDYDNVAFDIAGRMTALDAIHAHASNEGHYSFDFDDNDGLIGADYPGTAHDIGLTYDDEHNRTGVDRAGAAQSYNIGKDNRLESGEGYTYTHDGEGNITARAGGADDATYVFDQHNRLLRVERTAGTNVTYTYDVDGRRLTKFVEPNGFDPWGEAYVYEAGGNLTHVFGFLPQDTTPGGSGGGHCGLNHDPNVGPWATQSCEANDDTLTVIGGNPGNPGNPGSQASGPGTSATYQTLTLAQRYLHGPGPSEVLAEVHPYLSADANGNGSADTAWYLTDWRGSVRDVLAEDGRFTRHLLYSPFGELLDDGDDGDNGSGPQSTVGSMPNAGFEAPALPVGGSGAMPTGWYDASYTASGELEIATEDHAGTAPQGKNVVRLRAFGETEAAGIATTTSLALEPNVTYTLSVWAKSPGANFADPIQIGLRTASGELAVVHAPNTAFWQQVTLTYTAPANVTSGEAIEVTLRARTYTLGEAEVWFDDVQLVSNAIPQTPPAPRFQWSGLEHDASAGLTYMNARWYNPATGRFVSQDPLGFDAGDDNLYAYAGNDAIGMIDPSGEDPFGIFAAIAAITAVAWGGVTIAAHNSDRFAAGLADSGDWLGDATGLERFTIPLGFASIGWGPGSFSFGVGSGPLFGPLNVGGTTTVTEGDFGANVSVNGSVGLNVLGVNYAGFSAGLNVGMTFGDGGTSFGVDVNAGYGVVNAGTGIGSRGFDGVSVGLNLAPNPGERNGSNGLFGFTPSFGISYNLSNGQLSGSAGFVAARRPLPDSEASTDGDKPHFTVFGVSGETWRRWFARKDAAAKVSQAVVNGATNYIRTTGDVIESAFADAWDGRDQEASRQTARPSFNLGFGNQDQLRGASNAQPLPQAATLADSAPQIPKAALARQGDVPDTFGIDLYSLPMSLGIRIHGSYFNSPRHLAFETTADADSFTRRVYSNLDAANATDAILYFEGSGVDGLRYRGGVFDGDGRLSDIDLLAVSPTLFDRGIEYGKKPLDLRNGRFQPNEVHDPATYNIDRARNSAQRRKDRNRVREMNTRSKVLGVNDAIVDAMSQTGRSVGIAVASTAEVVDHKRNIPISRSFVRVKPVLRGFGIAGEVVGVGFLGYDFATSNDKTRVVVGESGAIAGSLAGAKFGAAGFALGPWVGVPTTIVGGVIGGVAGEQIVAGIYDNMRRPSAWPTPLQWGRNSPYHVPHHGPHMSRHAQELFRGQLYWDKVRQPNQQFGPHFFSDEMGSGIDMGQVNGMFEAQRRGN